MIVIGIDPAQDGFHAVALNAKADGEVFMETFREVYQAQKGVPVVRSAVLGQAFGRARLTAVSVMRSWSDPDEDNSVYAFVEEPVVAGARNIRTTIKIAQTVGAVVAGLSTSTSKVYLIPVSKWKQGTCGDGGAGKPQVALWLNHTHPNYAAQCDGSQDLIDSCALALYGLSIVHNAELVRSVGSPGEL